MTSTELQTLMQTARKERNPVKVTALSSVIAAIQERENRENITLDSDAIYSIIEKEATKFVESADVYNKVNRQEEAQHATECADLLKAMLPTKIDYSEYDNLIKVAINRTNAASMKDMGKVIAELKTQFGTRLDMKEVSSRVKSALQ